MNDYFSDRERGPRPRNEESVPASVWGGFVALVQSLVEKGAFGIDFPDNCPDGPVPVGTDAQAFALTLEAEIPAMSWPLDAKAMPDSLAVLDLLEFCYRHVAQPIDNGYHSFFKHRHLEFDRDVGQQQFRDQANRILARNSLAFELNADGRVVRIAPPLLRAEIDRIRYATGDDQLDSLLRTACDRFLSPLVDERRIGLEKLWDAWERIKSGKIPEDKKRSVALLLDQAVSEPVFRQALEVEAKEVTRIGNTFSIRHSETTQAQLEKSAHVDYLFHRLFSLIHLLLRDSTV